MVLFAVLAVAFGVLLHATPFGRSIYAIGANEEAAYFSGLRVKRIKLILFVLSGTVAALAGIVISLRNSTAAANVGQGFELTAITAVLLGGVSIFGGRGTIAGVILALFLLGGIQKALLLSESISSYWIQIVTGFLLVGSVLGPNLARRVEEARRRRSSHTKRRVHEVDTSARPLRAVRRARPGRGARRRRLRRAPRTTTARRASARARRRVGRRGADPGAEIKKGLKTVSIPKQLGNPYEEFEHSGIDEALKELGGSNRISGPTDAGASSQISIINAAVQQKPDAIIIAGNDPNAVAPGAQAGRASAASRSSAWTPTSRPTRAASSSTRSRRQLVGENQVESIAQADRRQGRHRDPLGDGQRDEPERLDQGHEGELKKPKYKDMKLVKVAYGDDDDQKSFQETQGLIQAYPNLKGIISPTTVGVAAAARYLSKSPQKGKVKLTGLGFPNQMRKFVKDGTVEEFQLWVPEGRRLPRRPGRRGARRRAASPARRARSSRPAGSATTRSARTARSCSAR